jgi:hydrogenase maturation protease
LTAEAESAAAASTGAGARAGSESESRAGVGARAGSGSESESESPAGVVARRLVPVFVCGEPARGDDAAGFAAVELLPPEVRALADIVAVGQLDVSLLVDLPDGQPCVLVDAVAGIAPGETWVRPLASLLEVPIARGRPAPHSSHLLPIDRVLALAAVLRPAPPAGTFVGIGGADFGLGSPLSPAVAAGLPAFAAAIADTIRAAARNVRSRRTAPQR